MTIDVEIVLRDRDYAVTERIPHPPRRPASWTDADVEQVLKDILLAIDRVKNPARGQQFVALRGFSWIVEPIGEGRVVIAIEIPTGAAVAGPFEAAQPVLDRSISRVIAQAAHVKPTVH
jgi:hypothetical protein